MILEKNIKQQRQNKNDNILAFDICACVIGRAEWFKLLYSHQVIGLPQRFYSWIPYVKIKSISHCQY